MNIIQHSPISHIDLDELLWLQGYGIFEPTHGSEIGNSFHFDVLPFEPDPQHSCSHGTERCQNAQQAGCVAVACVAVCSLIVAGAAFVAAWRAWG